MNIEFYKHQRELINLNPKKYLLAHETGTGKTFCLIGLIQKNNKLNEPVLIICIKSDFQKWVNIVKEFGINADIFTKENFRKAITGHYFKKAFDNGELVEIKKIRPAPEKLRKYDFVIVDEAHFFAGITSMMQKCLLAYLKLYDPQFVWLATATPYPGNPWNLYCLGRLLGHNWDYKRFSRHFFSLIRMGARMIPVKKKTINGRPIEKEIAAYINFLGKAVKLEECVDMPEKILIEEYFELTAEQKKAYKEVREDLVLTRNLKWHQICGGAVHSVDKLTGKDENLFFKSNKLNRIVELCEEHPKIFIVCKYQNEVDYLAKTLNAKIKGLNILKFTGKTSQNRPETAKSTDNLSECIIIANAACSAAYETKTIPLMVFYSYDFSLVNYIQMIGRIRRIDHPAPKTYLSLIVKDTIDSEVFDCIQNKKDFDAAIYHK